MINVNTTLTNNFDSKIQLLNCFFYFLFVKFLSDRVVKAARSVHSVMIDGNPGLIRDRKHHLKTYRYQHSLPYREITFCKMYADSNITFLSQTM